MREILRTNDMVVLSFAKVVLAEAGLHAMVADSHMSILEGSIGVFPQRILVADGEHDEARAALDEAGLGSWLTIA